MVRITFSSWLCIVLVAGMNSRTMACGQPTVPSTHGHSTDPIVALPENPTKRGSIFRTGSDLEVYAWARAFASNHPDGLTILSNVLRDPLVSHRFAIFEALGPRKGGNGLITKLALNELDGSDVSTVSAAISCLGRLGPDALVAVDDLVDTFAMSNSLAIRKAVVRSLGTIAPQDDRVSKVVTKALFDDSWAVRAEAAKVIAIMNPPPHGTVGTLMRAIRTNRRFPEAARALGVVGSFARRSTTLLVLELRTSENAHMRLACAKALGNVGARDANAINSLIAGLKDPYSAVCVNCAMSLGTLRPKGTAAQEALRSVCDSRDVRIRVAAANAYFEVGGNRDFSHRVLLEALRTMQKEDEDNRAISTEETIRQAIAGLERIKGTNR